MKIIEEDLVDWEPLLIRFVAVDQLRTDRRAELAAFLEQWFKENAAAQRSDCDIRYWDVRIDDLTAICEHLTPAALRRLLKSLGGRFPEIGHVRIGVALDGIPSGLDFKWMGFGVSVCISHPAGCHEAHDSPFSGVEDSAIRLCKLLSQGRKPGPVRKNLFHSMFFQNCILRATSFPAKEANRPIPRIA